MATLSLSCRSAEMKVTAAPVSERVTADMGAARLHLTADEAENHAHQQQTAAKQPRAAQQGGRRMIAAIAHHSNAQRAAATAGIVARTERRWGILPYQVVVAASIASNAVLRQGKSVAGAVASARRAARARAGAP